ncbi:hypothetical protein H5410_022524 [Solanum commersonii]|uniref:Bet v I/Major latex protein domain-containing protein n=1 Tax=Solanum commersonii TaxID=4109 RepID=A0A9J5ZE93_SOLCO|nr:hypothetical protein H5410_022524 [Solanum commersonii]
MSLNGKLVASMEVKCGGHLFHDLYQTSSHHVSNIDKVHHFNIHEGEDLKAGSVIGWKYTHDGKVKVTKQLIEAVDDEKKSITWKVLRGRYVGIKTEDTPKPITLLSLMIDITRDLEGHLHKI